jgi:Zn-dependent protease
VISSETVIAILVLAVPVIVAITFHEASHGYVARHYGDDTAARAGRITLNPLRHIDLFGTIILPFLLYRATGFVFGYAKPVPVNFRNLRNPRRHMVWVAAAGPAMNFLLAVASGLLFRAVAILPAEAHEVAQFAMIESIRVNLVLAAFNMLPLPPLDGGRVAVGLLPDALAFPLARLERVGMLLLIGVVFLVPFIADRAGVELDILGWVLDPIIGFLFQLVALLTGLPQ